MKAFASIFMLVLLLCNMLGLSLTVLCFESEYEMAIPARHGQTKNLKIYERLSKGNRTFFEVENELYRFEDQLYNVVEKVRTNDTLYVVLQPNAAAWQRFSELSEMMQEVHSDQKATRPISQAMKMLRDLTKVYLTSSGYVSEYEMVFKGFTNNILYADLRCVLESEFSELPSPPPKYS